MSIFLQLLKDNKKELIFLYKIYYRLMVNQVPEKMVQDPDVFINSYIEYYKNIKYNTYTTSSIYKNFFNFVLNNRGVLQLLKQGLTVTVQDTSPVDGKEISVNVVETNTDAGKFNISAIDTFTQEEIEYTIYTSPGEEDDIEYNVQQSEQDGIEYNVQLPEQDDIEYNVQLPEQDDIEYNVQQSDQDGIEYNVQQSEEDDIESERIEVHPITKNKLSIKHVVNLIDVSKINNENFKTRVTHSIASFIEYGQEYVEFIGCSYEKLPTSYSTLFKLKRLYRSAKTSGYSNKHFAFLVDLLDNAMDSDVDNETYILYTNMDCIVTKYIYSNIANSKADIIELHRRDCPINSSLSKIFAGDYTIKETGIDGFAIKVKTYKKIRKYLIGLMIGEPHWDTVFSGVVNKHCKKIEKDTTCLYHIEHKQTWSPKNLTKGGEKNKEIHYNLLQYGVVDLNIINLSIVKLHIVIDYMYDDSHELLKLCESFIGKECLLIEVEPTGSILPDRYQYLKHVKREKIKLPKQMLSIDQTNAILNKTILLDNNNTIYYDIYVAKPGKRVEKYENIAYNDILKDPFNIYDNTTTEQQLHYHLNNDGFLQSTI